MKDLMQCRKEIDEIDSRMTELFEKRMGIAAEVAEYKRVSGKKVFDKQREEEKLETIEKMEEEMAQKLAEDALLATPTPSPTPSPTPTPVVTDTPTATSPAPATPPPAAMNSSGTEQWMICCSAPG